MKTKGRPLSGHNKPLEVRTFADTQRGIAIELIMKTNGKTDRETGKGDDPRRLRTGFKRREKPA